MAVPAELPQPLTAELLSRTTMMLKNLPPTQIIALQAELLPPPITNPTLSMAILIPAKHLPLTLLDPPLTPIHQPLHPTIPTIALLDLRATATTLATVMQDLLETTTVLPDLPELLTTQTAALQDPLAATTTTTVALQDLPATATTLTTAEATPDLLTIPPTAQIARIVPTAEVTATLTPDRLTIAPAALPATPDLLTALPGVIQDPPTVLLDYIYYIIKKFFCQNFA